MRGLSENSAQRFLNGKNDCKVSVRTPSRLHFCLIDMNGQLGRVDGSFGIAIEKPSIELTAWLSDKLLVHGEDAIKTESIATSFLSRIGSKEKVTINLRKTIQEHVGLGAETQLSLAIAKSIAVLLGLDLSVIELARIMGRGGTSGIGVAAFDKGGLILDGGHSFGKKKEKEAFLPSNASVAPPARVLARYDFPEDWEFIVVTPAKSKGAYGQWEAEIFKKLCPIPASEVSMITRIIMMKLLPSLLDSDIETFGSGLSDLQSLGFAKAAKRLMNPTTRKCIKALLNGGAYGAGQSSFGPTAYGLVRRNEVKESLIASLKQLLNEAGGGDILLTGPNNLGAKITVSTKI